MSDSEPINKRSLIFWAIGLSILVVALTAVTFILMFPVNTDLPYASVSDVNSLNRTIYGLNADFPTTGNHCLSDYFSYVEIQNPDVDAGWIKYGNQTEIEQHLEKYCGLSLDDVESLRGFIFT